MFVSFKWTGQERKEIERKTQVYCPFLLFVSFLKGEKTQDGQKTWSLFVQNFLKWTDLRKKIKQHKPICLCFQTQQNLIKGKEVI